MEKSDFLNYLTLSSIIITPGGPFMPNLLGIMCNPLVTWQLHPPGSGRSNKHNTSSNNNNNSNTGREVGPTVCAPAVLPLSVRQSADAGFQSLLLQHAGGRAGRVEIQHLPGTHGQHVHAVKHDDGAVVPLVLCVMD